MEFLFHVWIEVIIYCKKFFPIILQNTMLIPNNYSKQRPSSNRLTQRGTATKPNFLEPLIDTFSSQSERGYYWNIALKVSASAVGLLIRSENMLTFRNMPRDSLRHPRMYKMECTIAANLPPPKYSIDPRRFRWNGYGTYVSDVIFETVAFKSANGGLIILYRIYLKSSLGWMYIAEVFWLRFFIIRCCLGWKIAL